jgi:hypothetical protein
MVQNMDRNMSQLLNIANVNNSIDLLFIVVLTATIPQVSQIGIDVSEEPAA